MNVLLAFGQKREVVRSEWLLIDLLKIVIEKGQCPTYVVLHESIHLNRVPDLTVRISEISFECNVLS